MIEAKCPRCGAYYCGWALLNPRHQTCSRCGVALEIKEHGRRVFKGYSPFTAERLIVDLSADVPPPPDEEKSKRRRKRQSPP